MIFILITKLFGFGLKQEAHLPKTYQKLSKYINTSKLLYSIANPASAQNSVLPISI